MTSLWASGHHLDANIGFNNYALHDGGGASFTLNPQNSTPYHNYVSLPFNCNKDQWPSFGHVIYQWNGTTCHSKSHDEFLSLWSRLSNINFHTMNFCLHSCSALSSICIIFSKLYLIFYCQVFEIRQVWFQLNNDKFFHSTTTKICILGPRKEYMPWMSNF